MRELSKKDYRDAKDVLKKGILRLHEQWLNKLAKLLASPYKDQENAYDRSMKITKMSRAWYKEAERMEMWYGRAYVTSAIAHFLDDGVLSEADVEHLSEDLQAEIDFFRG